MKRYIEIQVTEVIEKSVILEIGEEISEEDANELLEMEDDFEPFTENDLYWRVRNLEPEEYDSHGYKSMDIEIWEE